MRIVTPEGTIVDGVEKVLPVIEKRVTVGRHRFVLKVLPTQQECGNSLIFRMRKESMNIGFGCDRELFVVGNLKTEEVKRIQETLVKENCFDFSQMDFQIVQDERLLVRDDIGANPYFIQEHDIGYDGLMNRNESAYVFYDVDEFHSFGGETLWGNVPVGRKHFQPVPDPDYDDVAEDDWQEEDNE